MNKIKPFLHIVLFSIYPVLFLFTGNWVEFNFSYVFFPLFINLTLAFILFMATNKFLKNIRKSALLTSLMIIVLLNINFLNALYKTIIGDSAAFVFFILTIITVTLFSVLIIKKDFDEAKFTRILNAIAIVLVLMCFTMVPLNKYKEVISSIFKTVILHENQSANVNINSKENHRDIIYIILDGYANNKGLNDYYNYDNSEFLSWLENKGFYVANKSTTNYPCTALSMSSSLNMRYINKDMENVRNRNDFDLTLQNLRQNSKVIEVLKSKGYKFLYLPVVVNDMPELSKISDIKYYKNSPLLLNLFSYTLYTNSILGFLEEGLNKCNFKKYLPNTMKNSIQEAYRDNLLDSFKYLSEPDKISKEPKFIYAHVLAPHPPYLFNKDGDFLATKSVDFSANWLEKNSYIDYLIFINGKVQELIANIIKNSAQKPIIIIQSDHGSYYSFKKLQSQKTISSANFEDKYISNKEYIVNTFGILNAYYFPGDKKKQNLYKTITPANSFRVLLNTYFDYDLEILEDKNYFGYYGHASNMSDVTERVEKWFIY